MLSIGQRIKNLFGFNRPKSAVLITGPVNILPEAHLGPHNVELVNQRAKREYRREFLPVSIPVPGGVMPSTMPIYIPVEHHYYDPTPAPIQPEPFVGGGGESGGAGASGGWDSSSSSSCDSGSSSGGGGE